MLQNGKIIKWIIEIAALNKEQIEAITKLIRTIVLQNFNEKDYSKVYIKSSTGFYKTENGIPNGATLEAMKNIIKFARPLRVKAAGGIRNYKQAKQMVKLGVDRIGTSSALKICKGIKTSENY